VAAVVTAGESLSLAHRTKSLHPLLVIVGPTASGKTALALHLAGLLSGEIISCDAVAVYRGLDIGSAKPSLADRDRIPHHALDILDPDQPSTAGDYARAARAALGEIKTRSRFPIVTGGTGLYLRALLEGLAPAPPRNEAFRKRLRESASVRGPEYLHRLLRRLDPAAAAQIHPNDAPKLIRSLEVTLTARQPQTEQWRAGRDPLRGFNILQLGLNPSRAALYDRINARAAGMFEQGLIEETAALRRFGDDCRALGSLGYAQALGILRNELPLDAAVAAAQQRHRNYAKRQLTWFRRDKNIRWLAGFGDDPKIQAQALEFVRSSFNL
jgi:tRNA dimethylallyltransferase